jgi:Flp pilus assembly pilin Flp
MLRAIRKFMRREDGLVTIEWVALAAAVVVGGIAVVWVVMDQAGGVAKGVGATIGSANTSACTNATNVTGVGC